MQKKKNKAGNAASEREPSRARGVAKFDMIKFMCDASRSLTVATSEKELVEVVAKLCGRISGISLAWVGLAEADGTVRSLAHYPKGNRYLRGIKVRWDDTPLGSGPTGRAFRHGKVVILEDVDGDPSYAPWLAAARREGFCTSAAFPLIARCGVLGALNLYSNHRGFFSGQILEFLQSFAIQIAISLQNIRLFEKERAQTADLKARVTQSAAALRTTGAQLRKEAAELKRTRDESERLFDMTSSLLCVTDMKRMRPIYVNPAVEKITGYTFEELKDKPLADFIHPDDLDATVKAYQNRKGLRRTSLEHRIKNRDGTYRWVSADLVFSKRSGRCYSAGRDITGEKQDAGRIADALELRRKIIETAPIGIALFKAASGECVMANEAMMRIGGYRTFDDLMKNNFRTNRSWKTAGLLDAAEKVLASGVPGSKEVNATTDPGRRISVECYLASMMFEGEPHLLFEIVDLTDFKKVQKEREEAMALVGAARMATKTIESMMDPVIITDAEGRIRQFNNAFKQNFGYGNEMLGKQPLDMMEEKDVNRVREAMKELKERGFLKNLELGIRKKSGGVVPVLLNFTMMADSDGRQPNAIAVFRDISERKQMEELLRREEEKLRIAAQSANDVIWEWNIATGKLDWLGDIDALLGYHPGQFPRTIKAWENNVHPDDHDRIMAALDAHIKEGKMYYEEYRMIRKDGAIMHWRDSGTVIRDASGKSTRMVGVVCDITKQKVTDEQLQAVNERLGFVLSSMTDAYFALDKEWRFVEVNPAAQVQLFKNPASLLVGKVIWQEHPGAIDGLSHKQFRKAFAKEQPVHFEDSLVAGEKWFEIHAYPSGERLDVYLIDITKRRHAEEEQGRLLEELRQSNAELEQFAYVASHDLQEPLRMVSTYIQLLGSRYQGKLDKDADDFIQYAVDGSIRMQKMISGLLDFSRAGRSVNMMKPTDLNAVLAYAIDNLQFAIEDSRAEIEHDPLPTVMADESQMIQLFQNLISNAIKFQQSNQPHVNVTVKEEGKELLFSVADNGIGFDPKDKDRVFQVFQRLHRDQKYPGIGVGLAISKKIVEHHGGRIWAESSPGNGAVFHFTLSSK